jgi:Bacteriocin-protection, YdeI or OmpD-Associated
MTNEAQPIKIVVMEMLEKHLGDLFEAIVYCYRKEFLMPCLVLLYSGIDVAASLEPSAASGVGERFEKWVERYMLKGTSLPCTARELYAARCAVVHTFTPDSNLSKSGKARVHAFHSTTPVLKPADLRKVLLSDALARAKWEDITPLARNEWICWVLSVKKPETRRQHIERVSTELKEGMRRPCCWPGCPHR